MCMRMRVIFFLSSELGFSEGPKDTVKKSYIILLRADWKDYVRWSFVVCLCVGCGNKSSFNPREHDEDDDGLLLYII
jgi:hypothetical protein